MALVIVLSSEELVGLSTCHFVKPFFARVVAGWLLNVPATCACTTCCHTENDLADQNFYLTQSQYTLLESAVTLESTLLSEDAI